MRTSEINKRRIRHGS